MAQAIADGVALHAKEHPEDAGRGVDGVVANQCLMDTLGFAEGYYIRPFKRPVWGSGWRRSGNARVAFGNVVATRADSLWSMRRSHYFWRATTALIVS
jgi:hypothetical protein